jgi:hypothetical protein
VPSHVASAMNSQTRPAHEITIRCWRCSMHCCEAHSAARTCVSLLGLQVSYASEHMQASKQLLPSLTVAQSREYSIRSHCTLQINCNSATCPLHVTLSAGLVHNPHTRQIKSCTSHLVLVQKNGFILGSYHLSEKKCQDIRTHHSRH